MPEIVYKCSYCGNEYSSRMDARWCEILHTRCPQEEKIVFLEMSFSPQNKTRAYFALGVILSTARNFAVKILIVEIIRAF